MLYDERSRIIDPCRNDVNQIRVVDNIGLNPFGRGVNQIYSFPGKLSEKQVLIPDWARAMKITVPEVSGEYFLLSRTRIMNPNILSYTESLMTSPFWNRPINTHVDSNAINPPPGVSGGVHKITFAGSNILLRSAPLVGQGIVYKNGVTYTASMFLYVPSGQVGMASYVFSTDYGDGNQSYTSQQTIFNQWARFSLTTTLTADRNWIDYNLFDAAMTAPDNNNVIYIAAPQIVLGSKKQGYHPVLSSGTYLERILGDEYIHIENGEWIFCEGMREFYITHKGASDTSNYYASVEFI